MPSQKFRASVGLAVVGVDGRVLAVERFRQPGQWQLPQGGLGRGEEPIEGAYRELWEELGLRAKDVELVAEHPEWLAYELPEEMRTSKTGRGQVQRWFAFRFAGDSSRIRLDHGQDHRELRAWEWRRMDALATDVAPFRASLYRRLADVFADWTVEAGSPDRGP